MHSQILEYDAINVIPDGIVFIFICKSVNVCVCLEKRDTIGFELMFFFFFLFFLM